jgi:hypothetical protein
MLETNEVYRGIEVAQAMWGSARFDEIPPSDILAVIERLAHPGLDKKEWAGCCC